MSSPLLSLPSTKRRLTPDTLPLGLKFGSAGLSGVLSWVFVHPFNTCAVRMNLATLTAPAGTPALGFPSYLSTMVKQEGAMSLYKGLGAGIIRQVFYATSRFGLFEVFRDGAQEATGSVGVKERLAAGLASGGLAAIISCPAEVTLVRMANDAALPVDQRRNYKNAADGFIRIAKEDGVAAFWRGSVPFAQRAMVVGVCQVGTFDQGKQFYHDTLGLKRGTTLNVFAAAMTSGLFYALVTMPLESAKNRMAFQKPDPATGKLPYNSTVQTIGKVARAEGPLALWSGFAPYYGRCGSHTTLMFMFVSWLRDAYCDHANGQESA